MIKAGDTATFIYSTQYHLISVDRDADGLTIDLTDANTGTAATINAGTLGGVAASSYALKADTVANANVLHTLDAVKSSTNSKDVVGADVVTEMTNKTSSTLTSLVSGATVAKNALHKIGNVAICSLQLHSFSNSSIGTGTAIAQVPDTFKPLDDTNITGYVVRDNVTIMAPFTIKTDGKVYQGYSNTGTYSQFFFSGTYFVG